MRRILAAFVLSLALLAGGFTLPVARAFQPITQRQGDPSVTVFLVSITGRTNASLPQGRVSPIQHTNGS